MLPACLLGYHPEMSLTAADLLEWIQRLAINKDSSHHPLLKPYTWEILRQGMRMAARTGTGKQADPIDQYHVALKTGTTLNGHIYQSWAAGFFPFDNPQFIFCVRAHQGTSEEKAIPSLKALLRQYGAVVAF